MSNTKLLAGILLGLFCLSGATVVQAQGVSVQPVTWWEVLKQEVFGWPPPAAKVQPAAVSVTSTNANSARSISNTNENKVASNSNGAMPTATPLPTKAQLDQQMRTVTQVPSQKPTSPTAPAGSGCASTPLPSGFSAQTVRCDGNQWVANYTLMNNGQAVGVNGIDNTGNVSFTVTQVVPYATAAQFMATGNNGIGLISGGGPGGIGVWGAAGAGIFGIGILGHAPDGFGVFASSESGVGLRATSNTGDGIQGFTGGQATAAVRAQNYSPNGFAFYQDSPTNINYFAGRVGIGLTNPAAGFKLEVQGHQKVNGNLEVAGAVKGSQLCIGNDCRGVWPGGGATPGAGDNLGNHTATQDLNMNNNAITGVTKVYGREVEAANGPSSPYHTYLNYQNSGKNYIRGNTIFADIGGGNVGIGVDDPTAKLTVNGGIKLLPAPGRPACNESTRGTMWFVPDNGNGDDHLYFCMKHGGNFNWLGN